MVQCWLCGITVKPETRYLKCEKCHGHIVTPDPAKYPANAPKVKINSREAKRMMEHDTYERRHGRLRQTRHARD